MLSRSLRMPRRNDGLSDIWDTWQIRNRFAKSNGVFSCILFARIQSVDFRRNRNHHMRWVKAKHQFWIRDANQDRQPKIQSSLVKEDFQRIMGQTNNDCSQQHLFAGRSDSRLRYCTCSQFPAEAMQWIKEVELVDSVDELRSSSYTRGISMPNFEVFDARTASAQNKIIHNSHFKKKGQFGGTKSPERGTFPSRKTDCLLDLQFPGLGSPWFCRELCRPVH